MLGSRLEPKGLVRTLTVSVDVEARVERLRGNLRGPDEQLANREDNVQKR
jgi:hypothetical protein